ncbi:MAG: glycosyltransferase [Lachnospiraceae bacterium]|nr:glycosyltransferase [Lachnospiraceae bacterium]
MNETKPSVAVLMSTYNGQRFLREQIDSVLSQQNVRLTLFIRDDGSRDGTLPIIASYGNQVVCIRGTNIGVGNSFMAVLKYAGGNFDYYAFCDQDDIWIPDKLWEGIHAINWYGGPICYCSNQTLVDSEGEKLQERHIENIDTGYMRILSNNQVTGCTMVWNQALNNLLIDELRFPSSEVLKKRIHDVWVAMVASVVGRLVYDPDSYILYRQHENNVVGVKQRSLLYEWKKKIKNPSLRNGRSTLAKEIVEKYGDLILDSQIIERLKIYAYYQKDWKSKRMLLMDNEIHKYTGEPLLHFKGKVLLNLF